VQLKKKISCRESAKELLMLFGMVSTDHASPHALFCIFEKAHMLTLKIILFQRDHFRFGLDHFLHTTHLDFMKYLHPGIHAFCRYTYRFLITFTQCVRHT
jgi:hypothetical protein